MHTGNYSRTDKSSDRDKTSDSRDKCHKAKCCSSRRLAVSIAHLNWDRQKGDQQKVLGVGNETIAVNIKHLEKFAVLHSTCIVLCFSSLFQLCKSRHMCLNFVTGLACTIV